MWLSGLRELLAAAGGAVLALFLAHWKGYLQKKGENLATHEDIDMLLAQMKAVTQATKEIEAKISSDVWDRQKRWELKRDVLFGIAKEIASMQNGLLGVHVAFTVWREGGKDAEEAKTAALERWEQCEPLCDFALMQANLICGQQVIDAVGNAIQMMRESAHEIFVNDLDAYTKNRQKLVLAIQQASHAIRAELGI